MRHEDRGSKPTNEWMSSSEADSDRLRDFGGGGCVYFQRDALSGVGTNDSLGTL